ncbi:DeoR/GlpR family DNA-binding transcription regulator [Arsenicicoccus dermatophilus]|uniref:DeoR/GlpR family DNA-binding transcription regulator n=1 Tax=Arsenicicoccus dermatophilus TaxID=1076331 RepID=UPI0039173234
MSDEDVDRRHPVHQHERHQLIVERARSESRVEVAGLADELDVTPETIRRDLTVLERHGLVRRVHGGAIAVEKLAFEPTTQMRAEQRTAEKSAIAQRARELVPESGVVLLDAGTSTLALAHLLPTGGELTVVTSSLSIAQALSSREDVALYLLGGRVRVRTLAAVGAWAVDALRDVHVDVAFIGTNGLTIDEGLTTPDPSEAAVKRAMIGVAQRVVVVADHSKVGVAHFCRFGRLGDIDTFITDDGLDPETAAEISAHGPEVVRA